MLSVPLFAHHHGKTALNMYANQPYAFGTEDEVIGLTFANDAEAVLEVGRREKLYRQARTNRDLIGQAKEVLMERFTVDPVTALSLLAQLSRDHQQPVSVVARGLVGKWVGTSVTRYRSPAGAPIEQSPSAADGRRMSEEISCRPSPLAPYGGEPSGPSVGIRSSASATGSKR
jgi:hypothetical protein